MPVIVTNGLPGTGALSPESPSGELVDLQAEVSRILALATLSTPDGAADHVMAHDASDGVHKKILLDDLVAGGGEANTASNQGAGGVGVFDNKNGVDLELRNINAASSKISVALDGGNKEVDIDVVEANVNHDVLMNFLIAQHRVINDAGSSTIELWSADKIGAEIAAVAAGISIKPAVATSTFGVGDITLSGEQTLNGVLTSADRVIVTDQTLPEENGIYVSDAGAWARAPDADQDAEVTNGNLTYISNAVSTKFRHRYLLVTPNPIIVGVTGQQWEEIPGLQFGTTAGTAAEGNDPRIPAQDENDALLGTNGTPSTANRYVTNTDSRNTDSRVPTGAASGQLGGTYPSPDVRGLRTTTGPTLLAMGAVADQQFLKRDGATVVGVASPVPPSALAGQTGDITTTSVSDVIATGMTETPAAGTYLYFFAGSVDNATNNASIFLSIHVDNVQEASSETRYQRGNQLTSESFVSIARVVVDGAEQVEGRWRVSAGTGTMHQRVLTRVKVS